MKFRIRTSFGLGNSQALQICKNLSTLSLQKNEELVFDFTDYIENNPLSNLLLINSLKQCKKRFPDNKMSIIPKANDSYLPHIGFYQTIGIDFGKQPGEATASSSYVPISKVPLSGQDFYSNIESKSLQLAHTIQYEDELSKTLSYMFTETIRNSFEHTTEKEVLVAAQRWPSFNLLEIAIADSGCGIIGSLGTRYNAKEEKLLELACKPGISAKSNYSFLDEDSQWRNSGYGLYILKELALAYHGYFVLCSGKHALLYQYDDGTILERFVETNYFGTAIGLRLKTDLAKNFEEVLQNIVQRGQKEAESIEGAIRLASKSSGGRYILV